MICYDLLTVVSSIWGCIMTRPGICLQIYSGFG